MEGADEFELRLYVFSLPRGRQQNYFIRMILQQKEISGLVGGWQQGNRLCAQAGIRTRRRACKTRLKATRI